jgi:hypothetical protein
MVGASTDLTLSKSFILGNNLTGTGDFCTGGGIKISAGTATITNSVIAGNTTAAFKGDGGGIYNAGTLNLYFSTIADNYSARDGDGLYAGGIENIYNSIIWGNDGGDNVSGTPENLWLTETLSDPSFVSRSAATSGSPTTDGVYDLQSDSICIDTGDAEIFGDTNGAPAEDIAGNPRPTDIAGKGDGADDYDKGAYEYVP